ncbi:type VI secretion system tip protein VgrG [Pseudomonas putida]|uniref:type VI secretion system Vgr family protein n=1 Tax=Pseudomonas putida TaxID=303 RepID=UPI00236440B3|nr:type VI secretion system Vgr family protein [Pseudomonas putida]MDD1969106.1 type VI secretion system tip protein VgrG [Pseudomonas putida]
MTAPRLMPEFTQQDRLLRLHTRLGENILLAEYLGGWEALEQGGFSLQLSALSSDATLTLEQLVGSPVLLELLCDDSRTELRPFHGHVRRFGRVGSNGGLTRYRLHIEPWLMMLGDRQDSFAFHDMSVIDICEQIFGFYQGESIHPHWRWEVDVSLYPRRSLTAQYQETDLAFIERLLAEEGIAYRFEHQGEKDSLALGRHTLVLTDTNERLRTGDAVTVPFQRSDVTEARDSVQQWSSGARWVNPQFERQSWDHRSLSTRPTSFSADAVPMPGSVDRDICGPYGWIDAAQGERRVRQHRDAAHVSARQIHGQGSWRRMAAGVAVSLSGHGAASASGSWICLRVEHQARNNLDAQLQAQVEASLGKIHSDDPDWNGFGDREGETDDFVYRNRFSVLPANHLYRPQHEAGQYLHRTAIARGAQTAIVVGDGGPLLTDRDHRAKVQLHWQRGSKSASLRDHPQGPDNAPANGQSGTWVRVATGLAGNNWGSVFVPRVGQEVWVDFLEGSADRPVCVRALYNGLGTADAGHSRIAAGPSGSTANAASWFPGNDHSDVLHGLKTQDLSQSHTGTGGYRHLRLDHTSSQSHAQLYTTDQHSGLTLGHLKQGQDNKRLKNRGHGTDLSTQGHGAVRAGTGLLLSTVQTRQQMDASAVLTDLDNAQLLIDQLGDVALQNNAGLAQEVTPLPASEAVRQAQEILSSTAGGQRAGQGIGGGEGQVSAWSDPMLVVHGNAGLNSYTPKSHCWASGSHSLLTASADLNLTAQGKTQFVAGSGLVLYTQGDQADDRPIDQTGIALHAATGRVSLQAQTDLARLAAKRNVLLASTEANAHVQGNTHLLLTAQSAMVKLLGGTIDLSAAGSVLLKAGLHKWEGPKGGQALVGAMSKGELGACSLKNSDAGESAKGLQ